MLYGIFPPGLYDAMLSCFSPLEAIDVDAHLGGAWNIKLKRRVDKFDESLWFVGAHAQNLGLLLCLQSGSLHMGSSMPALLQACADVGFSLGLCVFLGLRFFGTEGRPVNAHECTPHLDRAATENYLDIADMVLDESLFFRRSQYLAQPAVTLGIVVEAGYETMYRKLVPRVAKLHQADALTKILHPKHINFLYYAMTHLPDKTRLSPHFLETAARLGNAKALEWAAKSFHSKIDAKIWAIAMENGHSMPNIVPDDYQPKADTWMRICAGGHYKQLAKAKTLDAECLEAAIKSGSPATIKMVAAKVPLIDWQPEHIRWAIESGPKLTPAEIATLPPWELDPVLVIVALARESGGKNDWHFLVRGEEIVMLVRYNRVSTLRHLAENGGIVFHEGAYAEALRLGYTEVAEIMRATRKRVAF